MIERQSRPNPVAACAAALLLAAAGCGGDTPAAQQRAGGPPPTAVKTVELAARPIEQTSEFIATVRSLQSTTVQPEVDGLVTRIFVRSGDRVRAGAPLVQINAEKQRATVRSAEANRAGTEADVVYWRQQVTRLESLVAAGAISRQEFEQAQNSLRTAEARLAALEAQVREGQVGWRRSGARCAWSTPVALRADESPAACPRKQAPGSAEVARRKP